MKCPKCTAEMIDGTLLIEGTILRFLFLVGWSWQSLWFKPEKRESGQKAKWLLLDSGESKPGHVCPRCGTTVMSS